MELVEITKLVSEQGVTVVCSASVIIVFIILFKKMVKNNDDLIGYLIQSKSSEEHHPSAQESELADIVNDKIVEILSKIAHDLGADRCYLYMYHNGGRSSSGLSFQRMSCISEVVSPGILPVSSDSQNLHKGSYSVLCKSLRDKHQYFIDDIESIKQSDTMTYFRAKMRHAESIYLEGIRDLDGYTVGFVGLDYCNKEGNGRSVSEIHRHLSFASTQIAPLVDIRKSS